MYRALSLAESVDSNSTALRLSAYSTPARKAALNNYASCLSFFTRHSPATPGLRPSHLEGPDRLLLLLGRPLFHQCLCRLFLRVLLSVHPLAHVCLLDSRQVKAV